MGLARGGWGKIVRTLKCSRVSIGRLLSRTVNGNVVALSSIQGGVTVVEEESVLGTRGCGV